MVCCLSEMKSIGGHYCEDFKFKSSSELNLSLVFNFASAINADRDSYMTK